MAASGVRPSSGLKISGLKISGLKISGLRIGGLKIGGLNPSSGLDPGRAVASGRGVTSSAGTDPSSAARLAWPDSLRIASIAAVVVLHSAAPLLLRDSAAEPLAWWVGNAWDSAVRWCVPVFVMLSGALLLGRDESIIRFFSRRVRRVLVPLIVWSVAYLYWARFFRGREFELASLPGRLVDGPVAFHLWFFYMVLGLYLLTPVLNRWLRVTGAAGAWLLLVPWLAWVGWTFAVDLGRETSGDPPPDLSPLPYLGYFVLGWLLRDLRLTRAGEAGVVLLLLIAYAVTAGGTAWLEASREGSRFEGVFYRFTAPNVVLLSVAVFLLGKNLPQGRSPRAAHWRRVLCDCVLGIYLVHVMVLELLKSGALGVTLDEGLVHPALGVPLLSVAVFFVSLALVLLLKRIPLVAESVP